MDAVTVKELMAEQLDRVRKARLCAAFGWEIEEKDLCVSRRSSSATLPREGLLVADAVRRLSRDAPLRMSSWM